MEVDKPDCIPPAQMAGRSTVLCRVVAHADTSRWSPGPAPFCLPSSASTDGKERHQATDASARATLVGDDLHDVLYDARRRSWLHVDAMICGHHVLALEVLTTGHDDTALLATHMDGDVPATLSRQPGSAEAEAFWETLATRFAEIGPYVGSAVRTVTFSASAPEEALTAAYESVTGLPDSSRRASRHALTVQKLDWSALVLRDGVAIVSHPTDDPEFAPYLRVQAHSVYVDALLLAWVQRILLDISAQIARHARLDIPDELVDLERRHYDFKRTAWRRSLTVKRTSPVDQVLAALQQELLTDHDVQDIEARVHDGARLARTLRQEDSARAQDELNRTVQRAAVVIGALGLAYSAAPTLMQPSLELFLWSTIAGLAAMAAALLVLAWIHRR